jgi:hypothetical protein
VAGVQLNRARGKDNASWLFGPAGELLAEYRKQHMVPYLESDLIGCALPCAAGQSGFCS